MLRIKELREYRNIKQGELAEALNVSQPTVAMWESGKRDPNTEDLNKLADFFGVSTDYLMGRSDSPHTGVIGAAHIDGDKTYEDLPPEAVQQIKDYHEYIRQKYGKKND